MAARFPGSAPTVYADKSTGNDVGDSLHWDGADANQVKAEIVAIAAKVGIDEDTNASSQDFRIRGLEARKRASTGNGTLANGTTTTVNDATALETSCVMVQGTNAGFAGLSTTVYVSGLAAGSFTLTHGQAAGTETFAYIVVN